MDIDVLETLVEGETSIDNLIESMRYQNDDITEKDVMTSLKVLDFTLFKATIGDTYGSPLIAINDKNVELTNDFSSALKKPFFKKRNL